MTTTSLPPLVLLHGFLSDHLLWDGVIQHLDKRIHVIAPDFPGFNGNPALTCPPSIDALADFVVETLHGQNITKACIAGMSMGGYVALAIAERHPQILAGLALVSTQASADTPAKRRLRGLTAAMIRHRGIHGILPEFLPLLFPKQGASAELMAVARSAALRASPEGACWSLAAMANRPERVKLLQGIQAPSLVIHGTEDQIMSLQHAREMAALLPNARLIEIPGVGHMTPWEAPRTLAEAFSSWVTSL